MKKFKALFIALLALLLILPGCQKKPVEPDKPAEKQTLDYNTQACTDITVVSNARQLGGYINSEGRVFKQNKLLRAGSLAGLDANGIDALQNKYKVCDIIDLRYEREINPNTMDKEVPGATYHLFQLAHSKATSEALFSKNPELYEEFLSLQRNARTPEGSFAVTKFQWEHGMLSSERMVEFFESEEAIESYKEIFKVLLNKPEDAAVVIHCAGGKDRTGVVCMLLLSALDFDRDLILQDYMLSNIANAPKIAQLTEFAKKYTDDAKAQYEMIFIQAVYQEIMEKQIDDFTAQYGSVKDFLKQKVGLTDDDFTKLKDLYLEKK
ncbi:MAG: tyrosine-protein phosphatase [Erysipelotrichaceae bacterium]|nr:tyrosine-protein phosphatase [Erysipelotrichaceae bacterium]MBQ1303649.1 tyrosine-protein phosphatase [Erysipelotrichaceae bacterium]MBQ2213393.1 tyrosine-protein phosphatase [Erysipelotrichaceae bacterium]